MARGTPDWVRATEISVSIGGVSIVPTTAQQVAAGGVGRYSGTDQTYQEVVKWTVAAEKVGDLKEILILSDTYAKTHIKIEVGTVTWAEDWIVLSSMPVIFEDLLLAAAIEVIVSAKSTDGTAIVVDAIIVSKEMG